MTKLTRTNVNTLFNSNKVNTQTQSSNELPKAEYWLNLGFYVPVLNEEKSHAEGKKVFDEVFISLPKGLVLDDIMTHAKITDKSGVLVKNKAAIYNKIATVMESLEPGQTKDIMSIVGQIRRVSNEAENTTIDLDEDNVDYINDLF